MAMLPPAKSHQQPLHNFPLSFLKWGHTNHANTSNRCRRLLSVSDTTTTAAAAAHRRLSPPTESSDSDHRKNHNCMKKYGQRKIDDGEDDGTNNGKLSDADVAQSSAADDGEVKPWKLRPRRSVISGSDVIPTAASNSKSRRLLRGTAVAVAVAEESETAEENKKKKKKKPKLWISLSKEEIEEDLYALTRSKPARRPKRRNKTIQKQIDSLFPGQYLIGISADSYRI